MAHGVMMQWIAIAGVVSSLVTPGISWAQQTFITGPYENEQAYLNDVNANATFVSISQSLGLIRAVELIVDDQVSGGCWTESSAAKAKIRVELERSGIPTYEEPLAFITQFTPRVGLSVLGYRLSGGVCVATASMEVVYWNRFDLGSLSYTGKVFYVSSLASEWSERSIFNEGPNVNSSVNKFVEEKINTLIADIIAQRRDPVVKEILGLFSDSAPTTQKQWDELMKKIGNK